MYNASAKYSFVDFLLEKKGLKEIKSQSLGMAAKSGLKYFCSLLATEVEGKSLEKIEHIGHLHTCFGVGAGECFN